MGVETQIAEYINSQPEKKRAEMQQLHERIMALKPGCKMWFEDGRNAEGKVVSNPNIGYGAYTINYANGTNRDFFRIGLSANTTGLSVYVLGLEDKAYLSKTYGNRLGKASVTGYCIKFKSLKDVDTAVLEEAIAYGFSQK
ncbi:MAG: DUF1801 domain-containing protein [Taibaiella sp.]|nr:DUF1801 domain-containing protein [Taibaiella sp.]